MNILSRKKAQEEIVGFVAIVVLVSVVIVVLLGISLNKEPASNSKESKELGRFLESSMEYTSDCSFVSDKYASLSELIKECYKNSGSRCSSGIEVCMAGEKALAETLAASWSVGANRPIKGYIFNSNYTQNLTQDVSKEIITITNGNCSSKYTTAEYLIPADNGIIINSFRLCY